MRLSRNLSCVGLDDNKYSKDKCQEAFIAYKDCKKQEVNSRPYSMQLRARAISKAPLCTCRLQLDTSVAWKNTKRTKAGFDSKTGGAQRLTPRLSQLYGAVQARFKRQHEERTANCFSSLAVPSVRLCALHKLASFAGHAGAVWLDALRTTPANTAADVLAELVKSAQPATGHV